MYTTCMKNAIFTYPEQQRDVAYSMAEEEAAADFAVLQQVMRLAAIVTLERELVSAAG